ncbi:MAG: M42 family metallopeptidase [Mycobacterium leprae]
MTTMIENLQRLAAIWGPSGREHKIAQALQEMIGPHVDEVRTDKFGNLIALKRGSGKGRLMLTAHMDTVGAMALNVSDKGMIYLAPVGNFKAHHAIGQRVLWGSGTTGVLQHEPVAEGKDIDFKKLWCDIGAANKEEALQRVRLGDMCVLVGEVSQMGDFMVGPAMDDRAGCAVLLEVASRMGKVEHDVAFVFTAQGEIGPRGAGPAAFGLDPEFAVVVDVTTAGDYAGAPRVDVKLGKGPALKLKDGAYMAHGGMADWVFQTAAGHNLPMQREIATAATEHNDAQVVSVAGQGIATAVLDIPSRYRSTAGEMVHTADLTAAAELLLKLVANPPELG